MVTPWQWILGPDVAASSKTIWAVMMGAVTPQDKGKWFFHGEPPLDADDLARCIRLLALFPEWKERLPEVAKIFPQWGPTIREWDKLSALYGTCRFRELEDFMSSLYDEGMVADGWTQERRGCWVRKCTS